MKHLHILLASSIAVIFASCSLLSPQQGTTIKGSDATIESDSHKTQNTTDKSSETTATATKSGTTKKKTKKNNSSKEKITVVQQSEANVQPNAEKPVAFTTDDRLEGEWTIVSAEGEQIPLLDEMPYINFENSTGRFYMSNTCNIINGDFKTTTNTQLIFSNILSTMKMCPDAEFEAAITAAVSTEHPVSYEITTEGHESYLELKNSKGTTVLKARKHNMEFLNGNWHIDRVGNHLIDDEEANVFIDIAELKIHGNTGCNYFNGDIYINPEKTNAIDFSNISSTRMACPKTAQESAILLALEQVTTAIQGNDNQAMLLDGSGKELMILTRIPAKE